MNDADMRRKYANWTREEMEDQMEMLNTMGKWQIEQANALERIYHINNEIKLAGDTDITATMIAARVMPQLDHEITMELLVRQCDFLMKQLFGQHV